MGSFAEMVVLFGAVAVLYFALTPLRRKIEHHLAKWLRNRFSSKRERPIIDINDYRKKFLDKVNLGASHLPPSLETQMQAKMAAQQQAQQAEYELQKQEMLAKANVAKATGEAQSILVRAKAEAEGNRLLQATLTAGMIQNKAIEKWNGILPQISGGATPFVNIQGMKAQPLVEAKD